MHRLLLMKTPSAQPPHSELRQDLVSGDWVLIAPGRAQRKLGAKVRRIKHKQIAKSVCPFENLLKASNGEMPLAQYGAPDDWRVAVIENRFPALSHGPECPVSLKHGLYEYLGGIGRHELVLTRNHRNNFAVLSSDQALEVFQAAADRFKKYQEDPCVRYASFFQNYGAAAGASQSHPHYQIVALPVIPPSVRHSLAASSAYFTAHKKCAHCAMLAYELKEGERIVFENDYAVAIAPFASSHSFEVRIFPKRHQAQFEETPVAEMAGVVDALAKALRAIDKALGDPDYNFFVHTTPIQSGGRHEHYHWHVEIMPRTEIFAGFELGTGMIINQVAPETAAQLLRKSL